MVKQHFNATESGMRSEIIQPAIVSQHSEYQINQHVVESNAPLKVSGQGRVLHKT